MSTDNSQPPPSPRLLRLPSSSVEIPQQKRRLSTWLSLGSYEDVLNSDFHYWEVKKQLQDNGMEMTRILRLHTPELRLRFDNEVETLTKSRPHGFNVNVKDLYHGTTAPLDQICAEGLDPRISVHGHFGRGIYFSDNPEMCRAFSELAVASSTDERFVIRCQVILGDAKEYYDGESAPGLTREPERNDTAAGKRSYYDSVQGKVGAYKQYVVYEKRRVYVQYVVFYKSDRPVPKLPEVPSLLTAGRRRCSRAGRCERRRVSDDDTDTDSDDERDTDSDDSDVDSSLRQQSAESLDQCSVPVLTDDSGRVTKVSVTRNRTRRRALQQAGDSSNAAVSHNDHAAAAAAASATSGPPHPDTSATSSRQEFEISAVQKLLELKGKISDKQMDDLITSYTATYGRPQLCSVAASQSPAAAVSVHDDQHPADADADAVARQQVLEHLVDEFVQLVVSVDRRSAQQYIISNQMNLEAAVGAFFDDQPS